MKNKQLHLSIAALSVVSLVSLDSLGIADALGRIGRSLGASQEALVWMVIAYTAAFAVTLRPGCALRGMYSPRSVFIAGQVVLALSSIMCAAAPTADWLIAGRIGQGAAAGLVVPTALSDLGATFSPRLDYALPGFIGGVAEWSAVFGPPACAAAADGLGWRWIFWINLPLCAVAAILAVPDRWTATLGPRRPLDVLGTLVLAGGAFGAAWGLTAGNALGWGDPRVIAALAAGLALLAYHASSRIPLGAFRLLRFAGARTSYALAHATLFGTVLLLPLYFASLGSDPMSAWTRLAPWAAALLLCVPLSGPLSRRMGTGPLAAAGLMTAAVALVLLAHGIEAGWSYPRQAGPLVLAGCGIAAALPAARDATRASQPHPPLSMSPDSLGSLRYLGGTLGFAVVAAVLDGRADSAGSADPTPPSFARTLEIIAVLCAAGAVAALLAMPGARARALNPDMPEPAVRRRSRTAGGGPLAHHSAGRTVIDKPPRTRRDSIGSAVT
jgi:MFS family permease